MGKTFATVVTCHWCDNIVTGDKKAHVAAGNPCLQTGDCQMLWKEHSSVDRAARELLSKETAEYAQSKKARKDAKNARREQNLAARGTVSQEHSRNHPKGSH